MKLQAFAGGLEGCDHHGAGRYEFEPSLGMFDFSQFVYPFGVVEINSEILMCIYIYILYNDCIM